MLYVVSKYDVGHYVRHGRTRDHVLLPGEAAHCGDSTFSAIYLGLGVADISITC